jgi:urate oxidase
MVRGGQAMSGDARFRISYGKAQVPFYRVYATPLTGLTPIPESGFTGRQNVLFAAEIDVEVFGENFLPAYLSGDNSLVVATDSMKNFVFQQALAYEGATLEGYLDFLGRRFLATYPQMEALRVTGRELPFTPAPVPGAEGAITESALLFQRQHGDHAFAALDFARAGGEVVATGHRCGVVGIELLKVTGSAFTRFVRDEFTTLPERGDRPLFITLDVSWSYGSLDDLLHIARGHYVAHEQMRDLVRVVFHEFVSESIQHLTHEMAQRALARFPQLAEIAFEGQNHTPDPMAVSSTDGKVKVYSSPFPAFGLIKLTVRRGE